MTSRTGSSKPIATTIIRWTADPGASSFWLTRAREGSADMRFAIVISAILVAAGSGLAQTPPRPATPQRTLGTAPAREESTAAPNNPARKPASSPDSGVNLDVLHTMKTSTEDLNAIRDANLQRVQKGACTPQIAA